MIVNKTVVEHVKPSSGPEPTNKQRRRFIGRALAALIGAALAALLASSPGVMAANKSTPNDPFILLLTGIYQPVLEGTGPADNLGLDRNTINLSDGSYSITQIYPIFGVDGANDQKKAIGTFYVSLTTGLCAYDLPGGAIAMQFLPPPAGAPPGFNSPVAFPDGGSGQYDELTAELTILEATGVYSAFKGGHNHMVDKLHQLVAGAPFADFPLSGYDEFCFCNISQYQFP